MDILTLDEFLSKSDQDVYEAIEGAESLDLKIKSENSEKVFSHEIIRTPAHFCDFLNEQIKKKMAFDKNVLLLQANTDLNEYYDKAIVNFEIKNLEFFYKYLSNFLLWNIVFIENVHLHPLDKGRFLRFSCCSFRKQLNYSLINNSYEYSTELSSCFVNRALIWGNCSLIDISNSKINKISMAGEACNKFRASNSTLNFSLQNAYINVIDLTRCTIEKSILARIHSLEVLVISMCTIKKESYLYFENCIQTKYGKISFEELSGSLKFNDTVFNELSFDFDSLKANGYKAIEVISGGVIEHDLTAENYKILYKVAKDKNDNQAFLYFENMEKVHRLKSKKIKALKENRYGYLPKWFGAKCYELFLGHFCSWKRILASMLYVILTYALLYTLNFEEIKNLDSGVCSDILKNGCGLYDLALLFFRSIYFSLITFTTVGYGDISPNDNSIISIFVGLEGLIGAILISFFTVSFVRRYAK